MHYDVDSNSFLSLLSSTIWSDGSSNFFKVDNDSCLFLIYCNVAIIHPQIVLHYRVNGINHSKLMKCKKTHFFQQKIDFDSDKVSWYFEIFNKNFTVYYSRDGVTKYEPNKSRCFSHLVSKTYPHWMLKSVLYQVFVDRYSKGTNDFRDSHPLDKKVRRKDIGTTPDSYNKSKCMDFYGGNLVGLQEKVSYLNDLGVSTVYLNPIFEAHSHHGYDCIDYDNIASTFGGNEALVNLSKQLVSYDMNYILDISINHTGSKHKWLSNPDTAEYYLGNENKKHQYWEGVSTLYTLDYSNQALKNHMYNDQDSILKKWLNEPYNCKGYRFDVGHSLGRSQEYFSHFDLWKEIRSELKSNNNENLVLSEYWHEASNYLKGDIWDSTTNYHGFLIPIRKFLGINLDKRNKVRYKFNSTLLVSSFKNALREVSFSQSLLQINMLGSHDISRLYNHKEVNEDSYFKLICLLFTFIGVPCLYYGDEIQLGGTTKTNEGYRYPMDWSSSAFKSIFFKNLKTIVKIRRRSRVLQTGSIYFLDTPKGVISYIRKLHDKVFFIYLNFTNENSDLTLNIPILCERETLKVKSVFDNQKSLDLKTINNLNSIDSGVYSN